MGVMKRLYTSRMTKTQRPQSLPDAAAIPRCDCGSRRYALALTFGRKDTARVDATCSKCGAIRKVHTYNSQEARTIAFGLTRK